MIRGSVNSRREATIPVTLRDDLGREHTVFAVIDTGNNGYLSLPADLIVKLGLQYVFQSEGTLADGSQVSFNVYEGALIWDGVDTVIEVDCMQSQPLVGMALLEGFDLHIRNQPGGGVTIEAIP